MQYIPDHKLQPGETEAVMVGAIRVSRRGRAGWHISLSDMAALWQAALDAHPTQPGERVYSGVFAGRSGHATRAQADAYSASVLKCIRAARRATKPKRDLKRAALQAAVQHHADMTHALIEMQRQRGAI